MAEKFRPERLALKARTVRAQGIALIVVRKFFNLCNKR